MMVFGVGMSKVGTIASTPTLVNTVMYSGPLSDDAVVNYTTFVLGAVDPTTLLSTGLSWGQVYWDHKSFKECEEAIVPLLSVVEE